MSEFTLLKLTRILKPKRVLNKRFFKQPTGFSIDSRILKKGEAFIAIKGKYFDGHQFIDEAIHKGAVLIVSENGKEKKKERVCSFVVENTISSLERVSKYIRERAAPKKVIAITGSVGKTTTKEMLFYLLREKFSVLCNKKSENNLLGVCKTLLNLKGEEMLILELGTNSPGEIERLTSLCRPHMGVITFIKSVHLEGLSSLKGVLEEKIAVIAKNADTIGILNRDDYLLRRVNLANRIFWFGRSREAHIYAKLLEKNERESIFSINDRYPLRLKTFASFFIYNTLASLLVAVLLGLDLKECIERMSEFEGFPPMRMEKIIKRGLLFINDAYNSNPFSLRESIRTLSVYSLPKVAVIADMLELGRRVYHYHRSLGHLLISAGFDYIITFGKHVYFLKEVLEKLGHPRVIHLDSHEKIASFLRKLTKNKKYLIFLKGSRNMKLEEVIRKF
ncbi:MAG: UDP-N-acetylmuramoyl-tripeptide--D-alanyl-D-alanine ligase [Candidatus Omnitrophica bacterium]|nr:UDP-N-acetylmuramoyl-tripeptide--D-alanyl-D-alanine ligase [Candidatus Omnitrophota bacterium]